MYLVILTVVAAIHKKWYFLIKKKNWTLGLRVAKQNWKPVWLRYMLDEKLYLNTPDF